MVANWRSWTRITEESDSAATLARISSTYRRAGDSPSRAASQAEFHTRVRGRLSLKSFR
ncbi:hypothetical protein AHiyo4_28390 [Arthrobacter sp. Hiyo4]|nr:hypothetical protein AHiyo4_28390 [Arthrobacter sp. Hiyo4]